MASPSYWDDDMDDAEDDLLDEDMEALRRACMITGKNPGDIGGLSAHDSDDGGSEVDDLDLVRDIQRRFMAPLAVLPAEPELAAPPSGIDDGDSDDDEDFETLRAIERRFARYGGGERCSGVQNSSLQLHNSEYFSPPISTLEQENSVNGRQHDETGNIVVAKDIASSDEQCSELRLSHLDTNFSYSAGLLKKSGFPKYGQMFIEAIKKNRSCQKLIRSKLLDLQAKIEENKKLTERIKCIVDFHDSCKRKAGRTTGLHKDPRVNLISLPKLSKKSKVEDKKSPLFYGPAENSHVQNFRMVLAKFPVALSRPPWSDADGKNLEKGVKQQLQELMLQKSMEPYFESEESLGYDISESIGSYEITPEDMHSFTPHVDWDRLASMYGMRRSGAECEARWLNMEDPLINHGAWTNQEDKKLLFIIQERSNIYNWIEIATFLGTNRTPCQCLMRYQRSLNAYILKKEWTEDEDAQLRAVVEVVGEDDWQLVACQLEGRTNRQCSNRWLKTLHPSRKRVGRWTVEEDKHLKVAVMLFGPKTWQKIAKFVPGRTQVQCRERWMNVLDPSLKLERWTKEEDSMLMAAIAEHGHCWSKVAALIPPRTDNQCRRRWKVLRPHEVHLAQEARKIQKAALLNNFADREAERPALGPDDFLIAAGNHSLAETAYEGRVEQPKKKQRNLRSTKQNMNSKWAQSVTSEENQNVDFVNDSTVLNHFLLKKRETRKRKTTELCLQVDSFSHIENHQCAQFLELSDHIDAHPTEVSRPSGRDKGKAHSRKAASRTGGTQVTMRRDFSEPVTVDVATMGTQDKQATVENELEGHSDCLEQLSRSTESTNVTRIHPKEKSKFRKSRSKGSVISNGQPIIIDDDEVLQKALQRCINYKTKKSMMDGSKFHACAEVHAGISNTNPVLDLSVPTILLDCLENNLQADLREQHGKSDVAGVEDAADNRIGDYASEHDRPLSLNSGDNFENLESNLRHIQGRLMPESIRDVELANSEYPRLGFDEGLSDRLKDIYEAVDEFSIISFFDGMGPLHPDYAPPLESCDGNSEPFGIQPVETELEVDNSAPRSNIVGEANSHARGRDVGINETRTLESRESKK